MNRSTFLLFTALFAALFLISCGEAEKEGGATNSGTGQTQESGEVADLSIKLEPGQGLQWKISWNDETVTQIPDEERGQGWNDVMEASGYTLTVEANADEMSPTSGAPIMNMIIPVVTSYYNSNEGNLEYSSDKPATTEQSMGYHHFLNRQVQFELKKTGQIVNLTRGKDIFNNFEDPALAGIGDAYMAEILQVYTYLLPGKQVKVGESWKVTHTYSTSTGIIMDLDLTLKSVKGGLADVDILTRARPNPNAIPTMLGTTEITFDLAGDGNGNMTIDLNTGLPLHSVHSFNLTGHTYFKSPDSPEPLKYFTTKGFYFEQETL